MKKINVLLLLLVIGCQAISYKSLSAVDVWLIGDSTMAEKKSNSTERDVRNTVYYRSGK